VQLLKNFPIFYRNQSYITVFTGALHWSLSSARSSRLSKEFVQASPLWHFVTSLFFYGEQLSAPRPTHNLENHPLSAARDYLFNIFTANFHIWRPSRPSATWGRVMPWWQETHPPNMRMYIISETKCYSRTHLQHAQYSQIVFWAVTPYSHAACYYCQGQSYLDTEDVGSMFFRNAGTRLRDDPVSSHRRLRSEQSRYNPLVHLSGAIQSTTLPFMKVSFRSPPKRKKLRLIPIPFV
jgi:hypothetical protein